MSKVGVAKSGGSVKEFIKQLFGSNEEASKQIDTLDDVKPGRKIGVEELEELKESEKRVQNLTEKYRIEKFETTQKLSKGKRVKEMKTIEVEKETEQEEKEQDQGIER